MTGNLRYKSIGYTGIEFETTVPTQENLSDMCNRIFSGTMKLTSDASSETPVMRVSSRMALFNPDEITLPGTPITVGAELVSTPLHPSEISQFVTRLTGFLDSLGESPRSQRSAIHIHCGFPMSLPLLKKSLLFATRFESLFYQLGGMGYKFRGLDNEAIYCKPLTSPWGPPIVLGSDDKWHQIFRTETVLEAETLEDFWERFGGVNEDTKRYHPSRYFWLNIFSTLLHGTLEFRVWNVTLNPRYLIAVVDLCQKVSEMLILVPIKRLENLEQHSVYLPQNNEVLLQSLLYLLETTETPVEPESKQVLSEILDNTKPVVLKPGFVKSHLFDRFILDSSHRTSPIVSSKDVRNSGYIDSHNEESRKVDLMGLFDRRSDV